MGEDHYYRAALLGLRAANSTESGPGSPSARPSTAAPSYVRRRSLREPVAGDRGVFGTVSTGNKRRYGFFAPAADGHYGTIATLGRRAWTTANGTADLCATGPLAPKLQPLRFSRLRASSTGYPIETGGAGRCKQGQQTRRWAFLAAALSVQ